MEPTDEIFVDIHSLEHTAGAMRQSLQSLLASMDAVSERLDLQDGENVRQLSAAMRSIYQLIRVSDNLNAFALLNKQSYPLRKQPMAVFAAVRALAERASELLAYLDITLELHLPEKDFTGSVDLSLMKLMVWNLLSNAASHAADKKLCLTAERSGKEEILLYLSNRAESGELLNVQRLFDRYSADPGDLGPREGTGLGLRIVLEAARLHGGNLILSSAPDGQVTAMLRLRTEKEAEETVRSTVLLPEQNLNDGLLGLSGILPLEAFDPRDLL